jgi:Tfp pilus assembly protein PilV
MGLVAWLLILVAVLVLAGLIAMTIYGGTVSPQQHQVEQVLPNDQFPR